MTKEQVAIGVLTILGRISGQPEGPGPYRDKVKYILTHGLDNDAWRVIEFVTVISWFNDDPTGYPDVIAKDFKTELDQLIGADSRTAPSGSDKIGAVVANAFYNAP